MSEFKIGQLVTAMTPRNPDADDDEIEPREVTGVVSCRWVEIFSYWQYWVDGVQVDEETIRPI